MNAVAQFIVELTWAMTMGILVAAGILAAKAAGIVIGLGVCGAAAWGWWRRRGKRGR